MTRHIIKSICFLNTIHNKVQHKFLLVQKIFQQNKIEASKFSNFIGNLILFKGMNVYKINTKHNQHYKFSTHNFWETKTSNMGHSMLHLKLHVTICHETFLFVLFRKEYKKWWRLKNFFEIALTLLELLRCEILVTRERFPPLFFRKLVATWILGKLNAWKLVPGFF